METEKATLNLSQMVRVLETLYPLRYAEDWDEPGLIVGDPFAPVRKIYCAVDPTEAVVEEALAWGADLLVTHHPLFFRSVHTVSGMGFRGTIVNKLIQSHCGLWVGHTNADAAHRGVSEALADGLGLVEQIPLVPIVDPAATASVGLGRVGNLPEAVTLEAFARSVVELLPHTQRGVDVAGDLGMQVRRVAVLGGSGDSLFDEVRASGADVYVTSDLRHHPVVDARQQAVREAELRVAEGAGEMTGGGSEAVGAAGIGAGAETRTGTGAGAGTGVGRSADAAVTASTTAATTASARAAAVAWPAFINTPHYASEKVWFNYALEDIPAACVQRYGVRPQMRLSSTNTDPFTAHFGPSLG